MNVLTKTGTASLTVMTFPSASPWLSVASVYTLQDLQPELGTDETSVFDKVLNTAPYRRMGKCSHLNLLRLIHTYHAVPLPCRSVKGLDCDFPI
jgi:hypothetical protein